MIPRQDCFQRSLFPLRQAISKFRATIQTSESAAEFLPAQIWGMSRQNLLREKERRVLTIKGLSDKPCFICNAREKTVEVSFGDKTFRGVLCLNHVFEKLKPEATSAGSQPANKSG